MISINTLLKQGRKEEIWTKYCGFLDLSINEFMEIQEHLLLEQIDLLGKCLMGRMLMGDVIPTTIEEFREVVRMVIIRNIWTKKETMFFPSNQSFGRTPQEEAEILDINGLLTQRKWLNGWGKLQLDR